LPVHSDENLLVGFDKSDDASVYRVSDTLALVQTLDFFPPIDDDPYIFGQIAATNALSDIYAMGAEPKLALNILCVPKKMDPSTVHAILAGGYDKVYEAGAILTGGHSIHDDVPKYGLSVTGFADPARILKNGGARPGDALLLTKPLGVGILSSARKGGLLSAETVETLRKQMTTLNKTARDCMMRFAVHACTDVTGFSLMGHLLEMMQASDASAEVYTGNVPILDGAQEFAEIGILPEGMYRNRRYAEPHVEAGGVPLNMQDALFDPQTSGGLLMAVAEKDADALLSALTGSVPCARRIGTVVDARGKRIYLL
ncbi:MAG: selenide, water dikinase SelD, partial [Eubacteriales bacterium]|nr:selenide, water dikinase SelD [Eubacteriales bacterium]